ncbi:hypothetical protein [Altibacter sp.]|uniref:hypothetical protein n=1 Tax=Altibacter sp. TaxID=2024823 RepID=UPI000C8C3DFB|nr:hypothetical protein [Altibacter sp.]MAP54473.1 hypothetical protein [Altibacter sp.]|tara:strand:+ start:256 stop:1020 length:765 start_codon:yes stop_codon:yes gene_type:complete
MIKFFRKIRHRLLAENKFSKYLLYAIGEIILVVIGILIALQINDWNEKRKIGNVEKEILNVLLEDLNAAKEYSEAYITSEQSYLDVIETVLHTDSIKTILSNTDRTREYFNKAFWDFEIKFPVINTYSDLKNAGKITLVQNDSIRERLSVLEANIYNLDKLIQDRMNVHQIRIDEICVEYVNFLPLLKYKMPDYNISLGPENDYIAIMAQPKVRNLMGIKSVLTNEALGYRKNLHNEIEAIIKLIRTELNEGKN